MFKNYFKTALNNILRNRIFSAINVLGLAIGISASLVLFLIVFYEFSYDRFEKDRETIFRVVMETRKDGVSNFGPAVPAPLSSAAPAELSSLVKSVPIFQFQGDATTNVTINKNSIFKHQDKIVFTNQQYFNLPGYEWLYGSEKFALLQPFEVVLTESRARQYYPGLELSEIIGKNIRYGDSLVTTVTGIVRDISRNTYFTAKEFISFPTVTSTALRRDFMMDVWNDWMSYSQLFVKLNSKDSKDRTEAVLTALYARHAGSNPAGAISFHLQPLNDLHFNFESVDHPTVNKSTLYGLFAIAGFLLFLGCINFINLTTAQSAGRAREIGIRKTMGGSRSQLVIQFMSETFFITVFATAIAICFLPVLLEVFKDFTPAGLSFASLDKFYLAVFLIILVLFVSLLAGFYPAIVLSKMSPVQNIKSKKGQGSLWLRKSFTVSQFVIAQFFIIATVMVSRQTNFVSNKDLGFTKNAILSFQIPRNSNNSQRQFFLKEVKNISGVRRASVGFVPPATDGPSYTNVKFKDGNPETKSDVQIRWGDTGYLGLYGIEITAGRNVRQSDTISEFMVNQAYTKMMGLTNPEEAIGRSLVFDEKLIPVVGVIRDFHERSLHSAIEPLVFASFNTQSNTIHIALETFNGRVGWTTTINHLQALFTKTYPQADFKFSFYDDTIAKFYESEVKTSRLLQWSTALTILVSCLGLLGLVIYSTGMRTREIGIRKILGASIFQIVKILSNDYLRLVLIACLIAIPFSWWIMNDWLQGFAFRTDFSISILILSAASLVGIALITLVIQTSRAALANPVKSLRSE